MILWTLKDDKVTCLLCPHYCVIPEGKTGICRTRINKNGVLHSLAYGKPCSVAIDPIEKKPLYHFLPGSRILSIATAGCNFRCLNCQNWTISQASPDKIDHYNLSPEQIVKMALHENVPSIAFTYTEPTVFYEYMFDIAVKAHENGLKTVMVSNGYINTAPLEALCPYIDAANIDLKCFDDKMYRHLTGGKLQPVLDTLLTLQKAGVWIEITHLIIPGMTDNPQWFEAMCRWLVEHGFANTPLHISRFFPSYKLPHVPPTPVEHILRAKETAEKCGLRFVYPGNI
ncbi:MAG TPA: AmmeMemoRadiSam system radical SAM enzyme [Bacteroidales bacterium]|nr:AmmeMemoRadiSam system radical SAM enzyme [Bacteroidales bacterium]